MTQSKTLIANRYTNKKCIIPEFVLVNKLILPHTVSVVLNVKKLN